MEIVSVPITSLSPHPRNYRAHPDQQLEHLQASLQEFGWARNVVISSDNVILAGHGIVEAARRRGETEVPVHRLNLPSTDPKAEKFMVLENEVSRLAEDDSEQLAALLADVQRTDGLEGTGWDDGALDALIGELAKLERANAPLEDPGPEEPPVEPVTKLGDVWLMGEHRLVCGDCTDGAVVEAATQGKRVSAILTDPPYQMGKDIAGDDLGDGDFAELHRAFIAALPAADACTFVSFHSTRTFPVVLDAARAGGWKFERMLWMYKPNDCTFPWRGWLLKSEACLLFSRGGGVWREAHPFAHDTYDHLHGAAQREDRGGHPACKPLAVVQDVASRVGEGTVFDPFFGSGTTLIAAEQLGRVCYGIEIEPRYVDVSVRRWCKATGRTATLEATGEPFPMPAPEGA